MTNVLEAIGAKCIHHTAKYTGWNIEQALNSGLASIGALVLAAQFPEHFADAVSY